MREEEAIQAAEKINSRFGIYIVFCPLTKDDCRNDCMCWGKAEPYVESSIIKKGDITDILVQKWNITKAHCTSPMIDGINIEVYHD